MGSSMGSSSGVDFISADLPSTLEDVQSVSEHLLDLWQSLASRSADEHLVFSMSFLLIEGLVTVAGAAPPDHGRLRIEVEVSQDQLQLRLSALPTESDLSTMPETHQVGVAVAS